ncbi:MAG: hypothetical protein QOD07_292 [Frankiaceae bacterium]|jgi:hypothetical protein|nr:hypothetical protein [Frankiaceae bacterium]
MTCSRCSTANPELARFCYRCGAGLGTTAADRTGHYAASPGEPVRALALVSTLMPHVSGSRHHLYKLGLALAGIAALVAAGFGILPVALICAGVALPGVLLMYLYDHEVWTGDPLTVVALCLGLAGVLGVGVGFLANALSASGATALTNSLPSTMRLLGLCLLLPLVTLVAVQVAPALVTSRPRFAHTLDALTFAALGGASLSLAESIVVQHGAFSSATVHGTGSGRDAFIALTLGFAKPVIYGAAGAITVMRLRRRTSAYPLGLLEGFLLIAVYDSAVATLSIYGDRGAVLTFVVAVVTAAVGLVRIRDEAHAALLDEATTATVATAGHYGGNCAECGLPLVAGSAFCLACGTAVAAMPKPHQQHVASYASTSA